MTQQSAPVQETPRAEGAAALGSMRRLLSENLGQRVTCTFWIGAVAEKTGVLDSVGTDVLVLRSDANGAYVACDLSSLQFVTFAGASPQVDESGAQSQQRPSGTSNDSGEDNATEQSQTALPRQNSLTNGAAQRQDNRVSDTPPAGSGAPTDSGAASRRPLGQTRPVSSTQPVNRARQAAFNYTKRKTR